MKIAPWILMFSLVSPLAIRAARPAQDAAATSGQQDDAVAAAARRTQEQKKNGSKPAKVWDNDNVPKTGVINVVGQTSESSADTSAPARDENTNAADSQNKTRAAGQANSPVVTKDQVAALQGDVESAKQSVEGLKTDLDILQRKYSLDQQSYYGKPEYSSDKAGQAALDDEKSQIDAKQEELADAQKHLDDLQAQLTAASSAGTSPESPAAPANPSVPAAPAAPSAQDSK